MTPTVIKLRNARLYTELPAEFVHDLLSDVLARYEGLFTYSEPVYPSGKSDFLFSVMSDGYGMPECDSSIGLCVIDLESINPTAASKTDPMWKDVHSGRAIVREFTEALNLIR